MDASAGRSTQSPSEQARQAVNGIADTAADALQRVSDTLRNKDLDSLVRDAESFARRQPLAFIGAAAVLGYVAVRFLKASERPQQVAPPL